MSMIHRHHTSPGKAAGTDWPLPHRIYLLAIGAAAVGVGVTWYDGLDRHATIPGLADLCTLGLVALLILGAHARTDLAWYKRIDAVEKRLDVLADSQRRVQRTLDASVSVVDQAGRVGCGREGTARLVVGVRQQRRASRPTPDAPPATQAGAAGRGERDGGDLVMEAELRGYLMAMYELEQRPGDDAGDGEDRPLVA